MFTFNEADIMALVSPVFWPFLRILAVFSSAPIFSARSVPMRSRVALAMLVAICAQAALADQPVIGLWPVSASATLDAILEAEGRHSLRQLAEAIGARMVKSAAQPDNINTPADLAAAEKRRGL